MKKQYASFICAIIISSNCYAGAMTATDEARLYFFRIAIDDAYKGSFIPRHDARAFICGLLSLIPTIYSGYRIGGILGNGIATGLATVTRDENLSKNFVAHSFKLGAGLGIVAGISMSHKFYQYLYDKWTKAADERVREVVVSWPQKRDLQNMNSRLTAKQCWNHNPVYCMQTYTFQENKDSYKKFKNILESQVVQ